MSISAERLRIEIARDVFIAEGDVALSRGGVLLRADRIQFDRARDLAEAEGNVVLVDGKSVLFCSQVTMKLPDLMGSLRNAELRIKGGVPENVREQLTREELRSYGEDELIISAGLLEREGTRRFRVEDGAVTACDCTEGQAPTWSISASSASVDLDSGATLWWPVFYAKGVPFFALPAFYVPLGDRRTGLLLPRFQTSAVTTFSLYQPLFLALGDSWDATIEPGFLWSRGPSGALELRYAPSQSTRGELRGTLTLDRGQINPEDGTYKRTLDRTIPRYAISGHHETRWNSGFLAGEINFLGDPNYLEFSDRYLSRRAEYSHSRITATHRAQDTVRVSGGLGFMEDLRTGTYSAPAGTELRDIEVLSGNLENGAGAIRYRLAELRMDAPLTPLFADDSLVFGEARLGVHVFSAPRPEVPRFLRADLRPRISAPLHLGTAAIFEPSVGLRLSGWTGRAEGEDLSASRAAAIAGARLSTELSRRFETFVHSVRPELAYVLVPYVEERGERARMETFDEIDRLAPVQQVALRIATDLHTLRGRRLGGFDVRAGRDLAFRGSAGAGWSEIVSRADIELAGDGWPLRLVLDGSIALSPEDGRSTELLLGSTIYSSRGDSLSARYGDFALRAPEHSLAAFEELVPSAAAPLPIGDGRWRAFRGLSLSLRTGTALWEDWGRLNLAIDASVVLEREGERPESQFGPVWLRDTRTTLTWASSCDCFGIGATVVTDRARPRVELAALVIDLGRLGAVRAE